MKMKIKKYVCLKTVDIIITGIDCMPENIAKLIDVFEFNENIEIAADMGFADEKNMPLEKIENFKLQHKASIKKNKYSNGLIRLIAPSRDCKNFLKDVFEFDIEALFILGIRDESLWTESPYYKNMRLGSKLINQNLLDVYLTAFIDESVIFISFNKEVYSAKQIAAKIKALF
ncbi:MAG: hypothetical protein VB064_08205 [Oscillospiraceae bacterium]|nr:hypothetical protein [Oscillospiraceae bacterium]